MSVGVVACNTRQIGPVWLGVLVKQTGVRMWLRACRGGPSGVCLVVAMGSIGSTEWPWSGVGHYVYLVMNTNIRLSC